MKCTVTALLLCTALLGVGSVLAQTPADAPASVNAPSAAVAVPQLAANGSFENLAGDGTATGWALFSFPPPPAPELLKRCGVTTGAARTGERCMKLDFSTLSANEAKTGNEMLLTQSIYGAPLQPLLGKKALFTMWVRYDSLCAPNKEGGYFPGPWFDFVADMPGGKRENLKGNVVVLNRTFFAPQGCATDAQIIGRWLKVEEKIQVPAEATSLTIRIGQQAWKSVNDAVEVNPTSVSIDDVGIEITEEGPR